MAIVIVMASATIKIAMKISIIIINQLNLGGGKTTEDITQANDENHKKGGTPPYAADHMPT